MRNTVWYLVCEILKDRGQTQMRGFLQNPSPLNIRCEVALAEILREILFTDFMSRAYTSSAGHVCK